MKTIALKLYSAEDTSRGITLDYFFAAELSLTYWENVFGGSTRIILCAPEKQHYYSFTEEGGEVSVTTTYNPTQANEVLNDWQRTALEQLSEYKQKRMDSEGAYFQTLLNNLAFHKTTLDNAKIDLVRHIHLASLEDIPAELKASLAMHTQAFTTAVSLQLNPKFNAILVLECS